MNDHLGCWKIVALAFVLACGAEVSAQEKGRKATVQGVLKARIEFKNTKHMAVEILADGEEAPRRYGVPYLPKEKGPVAEVHPAVLRANIGDRVACDLVYGAYGYESGFTVISFQVVKKADTKRVVLTDYFPPPESKGGWRTLLPDKEPPDASQKAKIREVAGVDYDKLAAAWEHNLRAEGSTGLLVIRRGYIVGEWYKDRDRTKTSSLWSSTKAYISTGIGLMVDDSDKGKLKGDKKLTLDTKVYNADWLPEGLPLSDPRKADITLRQLLTMTSGIQREGVKIDDAVKEKWKKAGGAGSFEVALGMIEGSPWAKLTGDPGTVFNYSSQSSLHLVLIFNRAVGRDLYPVMKERVFDPIGIEKLTWYTTGGKGKIGPYCSMGGVHTNPREHARFCYLSMHRGKWSGQQVVPASYYDYAWQGTKANPSYGAQWWNAARYKDVPNDLVQTYGRNFNDGYVVPSLDLVFVRMGDEVAYPANFQSDLVKKVLASVEK